MGEQQTKRGPGRPLSGITKKRIVIRLHEELRGYLELEAAQTGSRVGSRLHHAVQQELLKCRREGDYRLPGYVYSYEMTRSRGRQASKQMTLYITRESESLLRLLARENGNERTSVVLAGLVAMYYKEKGWLEI